MNFYSIRDWILDSIESLREKDFDYYIATGPSEEEQDVKIDMVILLDKTIKALTIYESKRLYMQFVSSSIMSYLEETNLKRSRIKCEIHLEEDTGFYLEDNLANSSKLRQFFKKIFDLKSGLSWAQPQRKNIVN